MVVIVWMLALDSRVVTSTHDNTNLNTFVACYRTANLSFVPMFMWVCLFFLRFIFFLSLLYFVERTLISNRVHEGESVCCLA